MIDAFITFYVNPMQWCYHDIFPICWIENKRYVITWQFPTIFLFTHATQFLIP